MIWFKEGEDEKETDLGLSLAEGGGRERRNKETERKKNCKREEKIREKVIYISHREAF